MCKVSISTIFVSRREGRGGGGGGGGIIFMLKYKVFMITMYFTLVASSPKVNQHISPDLLALGLGSCVMCHSLARFGFSHLVK